MSRKIKVNILSASGIEFKEIEIEEARKLIKESYTRGNIAIDKARGNVIDDISSETEEIILVGVLGGG